MGKSTAQKQKKKKSLTTTEKIKKEIKKEPIKIKPIWLSFGCTLVDIITGGGEGLGTTTGTIINLIAPESAGKTLIANEVIAANFHKYKKKLKWNYDDKERGNNFDTEKLYKMKIIPDDKKDVYTSKTVEQWDVNTNKFLKKKVSDNDIGIYVLDSLDGLSDEEKEERSEKRYKQGEKGEQIKDDGTYGTKTPKFLSQEFFRTKGDAFSNKNSILIIISQVRENFGATGPFAKKYKRSAGKALDHWAGIIIWFAVVTKIIKKGRTIGAIIEAKLTKSRHPRPFRKCRFIIYFEYGIDDIGSNLNYLYSCWGEKGKLNESSNTIPWGGTEAMTLDTLTTFLKEHNVYDNCRRKKKKETGKPNLTKDFIVKWCMSKDTMKKEFENVFGVPTSYDELIKQITLDSAMGKKLKQMVIDKWEAEEDEIAIKRPSKYS